jgi:hypothetical protein
MPWFGMAKKLSVSRPGLLQHAKAAQRELTRLSALLALTTSSSQTELVADVAEAQVTLAEIVDDIGELTAS